MFWDGCDLLKTREELQPPLVFIHTLTLSMTSWHWGEGPSPHLVKKRMVFEGEESYLKNNEGQKGLSSLQIMSETELGAEKMSPL